MNAKRQQRKGTPREKAWSLAGIADWDIGQSNIMTQRSLTILLVEDDSNDILLMEHAAASSGLGYRVQSVTDGVQAIRYLQGDPPYDDRSLYPGPAVILTDLKMPGMDGLELLRWLRNHAECQVIPTVVLSSSALARDIEESYQLGANSYICKPSSQHERIRMLRVLHEYWCMCQRPHIVEKCK